jgi:uncharacterized protein with HEPN domain
VNHDESIVLSDILEAILRAAEEIESFVAGLDQPSFEQDLRTVRGVMFNLVMIGEASNDLRKHFPHVVERYPNLPVRKAYALRNRLVHTYFEYNVGIIWQTAWQDVPALADMIRAIQRETD